MRIPFLSRLSNRKNLSSVKKPTKQSRSEAKINHKVSPFAEGIENLEGRRLLSGTTYPVWTAAQSFGVISPTATFVKKAGTINSTITGLFPASVATRAGSWVTARR